MLLVRLPVNRRLLVVKLWGSQKPYADFCLHRVLASLTLRCSRTKCSVFDPVEDYWESVICWPNKHTVSQLRGQIVVGDVRLRRMIWVIEALRGGWLSIRPAFPEDRSGSWDDWMWVNTVVKRILILEARQASTYLLPRPSVGYESLNLSIARSYFFL